MVARLGRARLVRGAARARLHAGSRGLPENWVFNTGDEDNPIRRLVSTFLSPLATAYVLVIVLLYLVARRRTWWTVAAGAIAYAGLLWTHTRAAYLALALGLVVLAVAQRRLLPVVLAAASLVVGVGFVKAFPHIGPSTSYTQAELVVPARAGPAGPRASATTRSARATPRPSSHLRNLRDGHPHVVAPPAGLRPRERGRERARARGVEIKAGESTYTELGVDIGSPGSLAFLRLDGGRARRALAALGLAQRRLGRDARDRRPDRRDRRALDRVRALRARRRGDRRRPAGDDEEPRPA